MDVNTAEPILIKFVVNLQVSSASDTVKFDSYRTTDPEGKKNKFEFHLNAVADKWYIIYK